MNDQLMTRSADECLDRPETDLGGIKDILNEHGERLEALETGQRGLQDELHYVKGRVDAIADHFGIT